MKHKLKIIYYPKIIMGKPEKFVLEETYNKFDDLLNYLIDWYDKVNITVIHISIHREI